MLTESRLRQLAGIQESYSFTDQNDKRNSARQKLQEFIWLKTRVKVYPGYDGANFIIDPDHKTTSLFQFRQICDLLTGRFDNVKIDYEEFIIRISHELNWK